jgi:hypothetical protein
LIVAAVWDVNAEDGSDHRGYTVLARKLREFLRWPNARHPVSWLFSVADGPSFQRTPASLGRSAASCMTNLADVSGQRTRRAG